MLCAVHLACNLVGLLFQTCLDVGVEEEFEVGFGVLGRCILIQDKLDQLLAVELIKFFFKRCFGHYSTVGLSHLSNQRKKRRCHSTAFWGLRIQWFSSG